MPEVATNQEEASLKEQALAWAEIPRRVADWVRESNKRRQLGISTRRYIFGLAIVMMIGDDSGCFSQLDDRGQEENADIIALDRVSLLERLAWESSLTEIPEDLRDKIADFKKQVELRPWGDVQTEQEVFNSWGKEVKGFVRKKLEEEKDPYYCKAKDEYDKHEPRINKRHDEATQPLTA